MQGIRFDSNWQQRSEASISQDGPRERCSRTSAFPRRHARSFSLRRHSGTRRLSAGPESITTDLGYGFRARHGVARRNDDREWVRIPAAVFARVVPIITPSPTEGAGNAGCRPHPRALRAKKSALAHASNHRAAKSTGIPCAMVFGLYAISPESGLDSLRHPGIIIQDLMPASGHQDHATSPSARGVTRQLTLRVHRIPPPTLVTIAKRPSWRAAGRWRDNHTFTKTGRDIFFTEGLDILSGKAKDCPTGKSLGASAGIADVPSVVAKRTDDPRRISSDKGERPW